MTAPRHTPVRIPQIPSAAPLSAQQKKFNRHIERINEERALLSAWQEAIAAYRERHAREVVPLRGSHIALLVELVQHLDAASDDKKLSKAARRSMAGRTLAMVGNTSTAARVVPTGRASHPVSAVPRSE